MQGKGRGTVASGPYVGPSPARGEPRQPLGHRGSVEGRHLKGGGALEIKGHYSSRSAPKRDNRARGRVWHGQHEATSRNAHLSDAGGILWAGRIGSGQRGLHAAWRRQEPPRPVWLTARRFFARSTTRPEVSPSTAGRRRLPEHPIRGAALDTRGRWLRTQILPCASHRAPFTQSGALCLSWNIAMRGQLAVWISQPRSLRPIVVVRRGLSRRWARRPKPARGSDPVVAHSRPASHEDASALELLGLAHARCPSENENQEDVEQDDDGRPGQDVVGPVHPDHATRLAGRHRTKAARAVLGPKRAPTYCTGPGLLGGKTSSNEGASRCDAATIRRSRRGRVMWASGNAQRVAFCRGHRGRALSDLARPGARAAPAHGRPHTLEVDAPRERPRSIELEPGAIASG